MIKTLIKKFIDLVMDIKGKQAELTGAINEDFWHGLNEPINKLIGSIDNSENGCIFEVIQALKEEN